MSGLLFQLLLHLLRHFRLIIDTYSSKSIETIWQIWLLLHVYLQLLILPTSTGQGNDLWYLSFIVMLKVKALMNMCLRQSRLNKMHVLSSQCSKILEHICPLSPVHTLGVYWHLLGSKEGVINTLLCIMPKFLPIILYGTYQELWAARRPTKERPTAI